MPVDVVADKNFVAGHVPGAGYTTRARNISGSTVAEGAVVVISATGANADILLSFTTTTTQDDPDVWGVLVDGPVEDGAVGKIMWEGMIDKLNVDGTTDIAAGDALGTFTTAGIAAKNSESRGAFAIALEAYTSDDSNGQIKAIITRRAASYATASGITLPDNVKLLFGTGNDAGIHYDGANLIIDPDAVGAGAILFNVGAGELMSFSENVATKITPNAAGWHEWQFFVDANRYASLNTGKATDSAPGTGNPLTNLNAISGSTAGSHTVRGQLSFHGIGADDTSVDIKGHSGSGDLTGLRLDADVLSGSMLPVFPTWTKSTTGDPSGSEGMWYVNTTDNVLKCYADGAWRTVASW